MMSCMCGDPACPSCGPAQGNFQCAICHEWASEGCDHLTEDDGVRLEFVRAYAYAEMKAEIADRQRYPDPKPDPSDDPPSARVLTLCAGCGETSVTVYCDACAKTAKCPHNEPVGACHACDVESDRAFDEAREDRR